MPLRNQQYADNRYSLPNPQRPGCGKIGYFNTLLFDVKFFLANFCLRVILTDLKSSEDEMKGNPARPGRLVSE